MLNRKIFNSELPKPIVGIMLWEMWMRAESLQRTQNEAWWSIDSGRLEKEIKEIIEDRDYLLSLLSPQETELT
jgi:hypothetical protein